MDYPRLCRFFMGALIVVYVLAPAGAQDTAGGKGPAPDVPGEAQPEEKSSGPPEGEKQAYELPEITVTQRAIARYVQATVTMEDLSAERRSKTADGLLAGVAGVDLSRRAFAGAESQKVRIRGFDERRSRIMLNGRPLHGAGVYGGYFVDWASLSLEDVEGIDIIRGAGPAKYGNTMGGMVNVVTKKPSKEPHGTVRGSYGNYGTYDGQASFSGGAGPVRVRVSGGHYETDGFLRNAYVDRDTLAGELTLDLPADLSLSASARRSTTEAGMIVYNMPDAAFYDRTEPRSDGGQLGGPGLALRQSRTGRLDWGDGSYWTDKREQYGLELARTSEEQLFDFHIQVYQIEQEREEYFYGIDNRQLLLRRDSEPERDNWGWRGDFKTVLESELLGKHTFEYGAEGNYLGYGAIKIRQVDPAYFFRTPTDMSDAGKDGIQEHEGAYVQDFWEVNKWLDLELGFRADTFEAYQQELVTPRFDEDKYSPRLGVTLHPWDGGHVTGRYAKAYRFPTQPEFYWWSEGFRPEQRKPLASESAQQWELEVGHEVTDKLTLTGRAYYYDVKNYIRTIFGYRPSRVIYSLDMVRVKGVEAEAAYELPWDFYVWANYTRQQAKKRGDILDLSSELSDELVELPRNKFNIGFGYRKEAGLDAELALRVVDARRQVVGDLTQSGASTLEKMPTFWDLGFRASYPVYRAKNGKFEARLTFALENILNDHYQEELGYPMPGRTATAGFRMSF